MGPLLQGTSDLWPQGEAHMQIAGQLRACLTQLPTGSLADSGSLMGAPGSDGGHRLQSCALPHILPTPVWCIPSACTSSSVAFKVTHTPSRTSLSSDSALGPGPLRQSASEGERCGSSQPGKQVRGLRLLPHPRAAAAGRPSLGHWVRGSTAAVPQTPQDMLLGCLHAVECGCSGRRGRGCQEEPGLLSGAALGRSWPWEEAARPSGTRRQ